MLMRTLYGALKLDCGAAMEAMINDYALHRMRALDDRQRER
jgi:hypothetical protein